MSSESTNAKVWSRFERTPPGGKTVKLKIQNLPKGKEAEIVEFMAKYFMHEETFSKTCGIAQNPHSVAEWKGLMLYLVEKYSALVCCLDTEDYSDEEPLQIVGCNCLIKAVKKDTLVANFETEELKKWFAIVMRPELSKPVYDKYDVDEYLGGAGLSVDPDYRGCGIAVELLKMRQPLCEDLGIAVTGTVFTAIASQRAAEKAGFELADEISFKSFGEQCGITFKTDIASFKIQSLRY